MREISKCYIKKKNGEKLSFYDLQIWTDIDSISIFDKKNNFVEYHYGTEFKILDYWNPDFSLIDEGIKTYKRIK